jgi:hypothetical protein
LHSLSHCNNTTVRSLLNGGSFSLTHCPQICVWKEISRPGFHISDMSKIMHALHYCPFAHKWQVVFVDPLSPNLHTEGNFQARFSRRKSIEYIELYRFTSSFFALRKYFDVQI